MGSEEQEIIFAMGRTLGAVVFAYFCWMVVVYRSALRKQRLKNRERERLIRDRLQIIDGETWGQQGKGDGGKG